MSRSRERSAGGRYWNHSETGHRRSRDRTGRRCSRSRRMTTRNTATSSGTCSSWPPSSSSVRPAVIVSQVTFEAHNPRCGRSPLFTVTYVIYQAISLPVNFTGPRLRPGRAPDAGPGLAPALVPERGYLPAHLRRADRGAAQHLDGRGRPGGCLPRRRPALRARRRRRPTRPARLAESFGFGYIRRPDLRALQEERQPAVRVRPHQRRIPGHPGRRLRAAARLPAPRRCPYLDDPAIAIVQTPQFFRGSAAQTWIESVRGRDPGGVLPVDPGGPRPVRRGDLRRDLRGLPAGRAGAAGRPDADPLRRGRAHRPGRAPGRLDHGLPADRALDRDLPGQSRRLRPPAVPLVHRERRGRVLTAAVVGADDHPGPAHLHLRLLLLRLHRPADLLRSDHPDRHARLPARPGPAAELHHPAPGHAHRVRPVPAVAPRQLRAVGLASGFARGWAHVFAIWDGARGKTMGWHPTRTPGSPLRRFRLGVTWWSGGMALLWLGLAIWRTFGLGLFAVRGPAVLRPVQSRRRQPGDLPREAGQHEIPPGDAAGRRCSRWPPSPDASPAVQLRRPAQPPVPRTPSLSPEPGSYLGVFEAGAPPDYGPIAASRRRQAGSRTWSGTSAAGRSRSPRRSRRCSARMAPSRSCRSIRPTPRCRRSPPAPTTTTCARTPTASATSATPWSSASGTR